MRLRPRTGSEKSPDSMSVRTIIDDGGVHVFWWSLVGFGASEVSRVVPGTGSVDLHRWETGTGNRRGFSGGRLSAVLSGSPCQPPVLMDADHRTVLHRYSTLPKRASWKGKTISSAHRMPRAVAPGRQVRYPSPCPSLSVVPGGQNWSAPGIVTKAPVSADVPRPSPRLQDPANGRVQVPPDPPPLPSEPIDEASSGSASGGQTTPPPIADHLNGSCEQTGTRARQSSACTEGEGYAPPNIKQFEQNRPNLHQFF